MDYLKEAQTLEAMAKRLRAMAAAAATEEAPFITWVGGDEPPVRGNVDVKIRSDFTHVNLPANALSWEHDGFSGDIIAYRLSAEQPE